MTTPPVVQVMGSTVRKAVCSNSDIFGTQSCARHVFALEAKPSITILTEVPAEPAAPSPQQPSGRRHVAQPMRRNQKGNCDERVIAHVQEITGKNIASLGARGGEHDSHHND